MLMALGGLRRKYPDRDTFSTAELTAHMEGVSLETVLAALGPDAEIEYYQVRPDGMAIVEALEGKCQS